MVPVPDRLRDRVLVALLLLGAVGCAPLAQPAVITPGGLFVGGNVDEDVDRRWCVPAEDDTLDCTALPPTAGRPFLAHAWRPAPDAPARVVSEHVGRGFVHCAPDADDCETVDFEDPHEWARPWGGVASGDVDGDGLDDLVFTAITDEAGDRVPARLCRGTGDGGTEDCEALDVDSGRDSEPTLADLDGDGALDLLVGVLDTDTWASDPVVCMGEGDGGFDCADWSPLDPETHSPLAKHLDVADLDGDGQQDVLIILSPSHNAAPVWCEGDPDVAPERWCIDTPKHTVAVPEFYWSGTGESYPVPLFRVSLRDLDEDGDRDILGVTQSGGVVTCENPGDGDFVCGETLVLGEGNVGPDMLAVADLDGDGVVEVFVVAVVVEDGVNTDVLHRCRGGLDGLRCEAMDVAHPLSIEAFGATVEP